MRILFISRAYPPVTGGIENQNYELSRWLPREPHVTVKTVANKKGKKFLPFFLPYAAIMAVFRMKKFDALLLGDGVLSEVGWFSKLFHPKKPVVCIVHGLDLTFNFNLYQKLWVGFFIKKMDRLIAVGNETKRVAIKRGISNDKVFFIPNGVDTDKHLESHSREDLEKILNEDLRDKKIILTSGRLAKRKGVAWFIENVMPRLPFNIIYAVSGDGPDRKNIENAIKEHKMADRVKLLGYVSNETRNVLLNTCDLFIQPNIKVEGDMEGFGISVIEAASCKLPVIASRLEGLQDAIKDGENGFLVEPYDANAYAEKIVDLLENEQYRKNFGEKARKFCQDHYHWQKIAKIYIQEIRKLLANK